MTAQHILVPTDLSEYANQALKEAVELAQHLQSRLTLLHVIDTRPLGLVEGTAMLPPSVWQEVETGIEQSMEASLQRLGDGGIQGEMVIARGVPFDIIINTAKDRGADLIVMGTHGRTGFTHALIGSVAEKVVRLAPCPVLVTRGMTETTDA